MDPQANFRKSKDDEPEPRGTAEKPIFQPPTFARPIISTQDTFDQNTQVEPLTDPFALGTRPIWNTPNVAVTAEKIGTIKASATVYSVSPSTPTVGGMFQGPTTNVATFTVVPNMAQTARASGPVQVNFALTVKTANANDPFTYAIFRNGVQVSQTYQSAAGAANTAFSIQGSYTDNPPLGVQVYDVRWARGASLLTALGGQRTLQVLNLRAQ